MNTLHDDYETLITSINNLKFYRVPDDEIKGLIEQIDNVIDRLMDGDNL